MTELIRPMKALVLILAGGLTLASSAHAQQTNPNTLQGCPFEVSLQQIDSFAEHRYGELAHVQAQLVREMAEASKNATKPNVEIGLQMAPDELQRFNTARHRAIETGAEELKFSKLQRDEHVIAEVLAVAKLSDLYEVRQSDLQRDDPRQFYYKILLMLRANQPQVSQSTRVDFGIDCDPEAGLYWEEDFALHELANVPDSHMTNLVSDIERIRTLYQLCWKLFMHGIDDIHATRWNGDEPFMPDSITLMINGSNETIKRLYNIVIAYVDAQMPSEKEFEIKYTQSVVDQANRKFPVDKQ
jgi:hypothetical protein